MIPVGHQPILWHVMKTYSHYGFRKFILCLGYKSDLIKRYFLDYQAEVSDFTLHMGDGHRQQFHNSYGHEDWEVTFAETGLLVGFLLPGDTLLVIAGLLFILPGVVALG